MVHIVSPLPKQHTPKDGRTYSWHHLKNISKDLFVGGRSDVQYGDHTLITLESWMYI